MHTTIHGSAGMGKCKLAKRVARAGFFGRKPCPHQPSQASTPQSWRPSQRTCHTSIAPLAVHCAPAHY